MDFDFIYKKYYAELYYFALKQNQSTTETADVSQAVYGTPHS
jgi:hypothetical protein